MHASAITTCVFLANKSNLKLNLNLKECERERSSLCIFPCLFSVSIRKAFDHLHSSTFLQGKIGSSAWPCTVPLSFRARGSREDHGKTSTKAGGLSPATHALPVKYDKRQTPRQSANYKGNVRRQRRLNRTILRNYQLICLLKGQMKCEIRKRTVQSCRQQYKFTDAVLPVQEQDQCGLDKGSRGVCSLHEMLNRPVRVTKPRLQSKNKRRLRIFCEAVESLPLKSSFNTMRCWVQLPSEYKDRLPDAQSMSHV